tara:strand:- start:22 stop:261 length:240 start_codon:yes stop_codon:yes gene_type:complete
MPNNYDFSNDNKYKDDRWDKEYKLTSKSQKNIDENTKYVSAYPSTITVFNFKETLKANLKYILSFALGLLTYEVISWWL